MNYIPFLYDEQWHKHEISYNKFYNIDLIANETIRNQNVIYPILIYKNPKTSKNFISIGSFNSVTPHFINHSGFDTSSFKKLFKKYMKISEEIIREYNVDRWLIHQFPLFTFNRPFSMCEELGYKTYNRGRSFIDLKNFNIDIIKASIRTRYKGYINKNKNKINIYYGNIPSNVFKNFVNKHFSLAKRKTKSDYCWAILKEFIDNKKALNMLLPPPVVP